MMKLPLLLTALSLIAATPASATYEEELKKAQSTLPLRSKAYTENEIMNALSPHLVPTIKPFYQSSLTIMFSQFGEAKHDATFIIEGWQCLLARVTDAKTTPKTEDEDQRTALLDTLALHKKILKRLAEADGASSEIQTLWREVQDHAPCENCIKRIVHTYGLKVPKVSLGVTDHQTSQNTPLKTTPPIEATAPTTPHAPLPVRAEPPSTGALASAARALHGAGEIVGGALRSAGRIVVAVLEHGKDLDVGTGNF